MSLECGLRSTGDNISTVFVKKLQDIHLTIFKCFFQERIQTSCLLSTFYLIFWKQLILCHSITHTIHQQCLKLVHLWYPIHTECMYFPTGMGRIGKTDRHCFLWAAHLCKTVSKHTQLCSSTSIQVQRHCYLFSGAHAEPVWRFTKVKLQHAQQESLPTFNSQLVGPNKKTEVMKQKVPDYYAGQLYPCKFKSILHSTATLQRIHPEAWSLKRI